MHSDRAVVTHYKWKSTEGERLRSVGLIRLWSTLLCTLTQLSELAVSEMALNLASKIKGEERKCWCICSVTCWCWGVKVRPCDCCLGCVSCLLTPGTIVGALANNAPPFFSLIWLKASRESSLRAVSPQLIVLSDIYIFLSWGCFEGDICGRNNPKSGQVVPGEGWTERNSVSPSVVLWIQPSQAVEAPPGLQLYAIKNIYCHMKI